MVEQPKRNVAGRPRRQVENDLPARRPDEAALCQRAGHQPGAVRPGREGEELEEAIFDRQARQGGGQRRLVIGTKVEAGFCHGVQHQLGDLRSLHLMGRPRRRELLDLPQRERVQRIGHGQGQPPGIDDPDDEAPPSLVDEAPRRAAAPREGIAAAAEREMDQRIGLQHSLGLEHRLGRFLAGELAEMLDDSGGQRLAQPLQCL